MPKAFHEAIRSFLKEGRRAKGIPDRDVYGDPSTLPVGKQIPYVIQRHLAEKAGPHYDVRFGPKKLFSWAVPKNLPEQPGQRALAIAQPLHSGSYANFEGVISEGYGKGEVTTHKKGSIIVTQASPTKIKFVVASDKGQEQFALVKMGGRGKRNWLMVNTTPNEMLPHKKVNYKQVPAEDVEKLFNEDYLTTAKLDGAAMLYKILGDRIEVLSYRADKAGKPIIHTYRVMGPGGSATGLQIPKELQDSVLRGEVIGVRKGKAIPAAELGGILNAVLGKSLGKQEEQGIELKNAIFNVLRKGGKPFPQDAPAEERRKAVQEFLKVLPKDKFMEPPTADTPEEARKMWEQITSGKHPLTSEGIVAWPAEGGKPTKVKTYPESDVLVKEVFPGAGRLAGTAAGGFRYALPEDPEKVVGEVGTGFTDEVRRWLWENREDPELLGRTARIRAQEQFPSGAYRAPSFIAMHEDIPVKAASESLRDKVRKSFFPDEETKKEAKTTSDEKKVLKAIEAMDFGDPLMSHIQEAVDLPKEKVSKTVSSLVRSGKLRQKEDSIDHDWTYRLTDAGKKTAADFVKTAIIRRVGDKWVLYSHKGKVLGRHDSEAGAQRQERAIQASKHGEDLVIVNDIPEWSIKEAKKKRIQGQTDEHMSHLTSLKVDPTVVEGLQDMKDEEKQMAKDEKAKKKREREYISTKVSNERKRSPWTDQDFDEDGVPLGELMGFKLSEVQDPSLSGQKHRRLDLHDEEDKNVAYTILRPTVDGEDMRLSALWVSPGHRKKGVAKALISLAKKESAGKDLFIQANPYDDKPMNRRKLIDFYQKMGFMKDPKGDWNHLVARQKSPLNS